MKTWWMIATIALAACETKDLAPRIKGTRLAEGTPSQVFVSPDGAWAAALTETGAAKEQGAPQDLLLGSLVVAPVEGGASRRLGGGVSNLPGSLLFSKNGQWLAFLAGYGVRKATGELRLAKEAGGDAESIATDVSFFTFAPASDRIAYVANSELFVRDLATGETKDVTSGVSVAEFGPKADDAILRVKRRMQAGGALLEYQLKTGVLTALARGVGTFVCTPAKASEGAARTDFCVFDAQNPLSAKELEPESPFAPKKVTPVPGLYVSVAGGAAKKVGEDVPNELRFAPDASGRVAYITQPKGGANAGDVWILDPGKTPTLVREKVQSMQFSPDGSLAILGAFDSSSTAKLYVLPAGASEAFEIARNVKVLPQSPRAYGFTPKGRWLLFHQVQTLGGHYSIVLGAWDMKGPRDQKLRWIDTGAFGYVIDDAEKRLAYKARCIDQGRACSLFVQDLETPAAGELVPEGMPGTTPIVSRVAAFDWVPGTDALAIITSRRGPKLSGQLLFALGVVPPIGNGRVTLLDDQITGDFAFAGPDKHTLVYAVTERDREGLHKARVPDAPPAVQLPPQ